MLCKNCGRRVDADEKHCICGRNPLGEDKNDFEIIKQILSGVSQTEALKNNSNSIMYVTEPPQRPKVKDCSKYGKNDGMIFDIDERLEYSYNGGKAFESVPGKAIRDLPAENYIFRDKTDHKIIYHITVNEPKRNYFFIAVIIPVCLVLVIVAAAIVGLPKLSGVLKTHDSGESASTTKTVSTTETKKEKTVEMIVYGVDDSDLDNNYLTLYEDSKLNNEIKNINFIKNQTTIKCYTNESNNKSTAICLNNKKYYLPSKYLFNNVEKNKKNKYYAIDDVKISSSIFYYGTTTETVKFGDKINLVRENDSYYQIKYNKKFYYIKRAEFKENFTDNEPKFKWINEKVKVFSKPSNDDVKSKIYKELGKNLVIKFNNDFYYIKYKNKIWYIESDKLSDKPKSTSATTTTTTYQPTQWTSQYNPPQTQRQIYNPKNVNENRKKVEQEIVIKK